MQELASKIRVTRERLGWSRRRLASVAGMSTRWVEAAENNRDPRPKKEERRIKMVFIPFLGYSVRCVQYHPVTDRRFDLTQCQYRIASTLGV